MTQPDYKNRQGTRKKFQLTPKPSGMKISKTELCLQERLERRSWALRPVPRTVARRESGKVVRMKATAWRGSSSLHAGTEVGEKTTPSRTGTRGGGGEAPPGAGWGPAN